MKYVLLADGTRIDNCSDSTTSNSIYAVRSSYEEAGAVRDLFTKENVSCIRVYDSNNVLVVTGTGLALVPGANIAESGDTFVCEINTRKKTDIELMQDEITELQDTVLG